MVNYCCRGGHLGYAIGTKITNLVEDHPVIISIMLQFHRLSSFLLQSFNQSEHIIGPGSHVGFSICTKITNLVEDLPNEHFCQVWSKSVQWFQRRWKYEKLTDAGYIIQMKNIFCWKFWKIIINVFPLDYYKHKFIIAIFLSLAVFGFILNKIPFKWYKVSEFAKCVSPVRHDQQFFFAKDWHKIGILQ